MALTAILRRSATCVVPLAARVIGSQTRNHHHLSALFAAVNHSDATRTVLSNGLFPSRFHYSSSAVTRPVSDKSLLLVIESEIQCAEESGTNEVEEVPKGFPFEIEDNVGQQTITLSREYQGETINIQVETSSLLSGEEDENDNDNDNDDDTEKGSQSSVPMVVRISKKDGPSLEFGVTAYPDEIAIDSLSVRDPANPDDQLAYEGPAFDDLDENLQKGFHKYLEIRGLKPSVTNFLHEYMLAKEHREYTNWLKNLKKFVEA